MHHKKIILFLLTSILSLSANSQPLRLHLGCGQVRLPDYVNIDFPPSEHTVQTTQAADYFADITKLEFATNSVDEVRSHHVFEHFERSVALALLCSWHRWLKVSGKLVIETPDFLRSIKIILDTQYTYEQKQGTLRHIFGSHEASWAVHWDGWYKEKFERVLTQFGFGNIQVKFTQWKLCPNIIVTAHKQANLSAQQLASRAKLILRDSMVNNVSSEKHLWHVWCDEFDKCFSYKSNSMATL